LTVVIHSWSVDTDYNQAAEATAVVWVIRAVSFDLQQQQQQQQQQQ